jgi:hypothetical protein
MTAVSRLTPEIDHDARHAIGEGLRDVYGSVVQENLPRELRDPLERLQAPLATPAANGAAPVFIAAILAGAVLLTLAALAAWLVWNQAV